MGSLKDQLAKAGLVSEQDVQRARMAERSKEEAALKVVQKQAVAKYADTLNGVEDAATVREFRDRARKLLVEQPELINRVIQFAHKFKDQEGGKKLIWQAFSVREQLQQVPGPQRDRFLRRAFRSHGGTMEVPDLPTSSDTETK